jgi:hypothetical protein
VNLNELLHKNLLILKNSPAQLPPLRGGAAQDRKKYELTQSGHTTLFRVTSGVELERVFKSDGFHFENIAFGCPPPSDCPLDKIAYYWSQHHWDAERFAAYTVRTVSSEERVHYTHTLP